ncbi:hypothetical protein [Stenotrophomonas maltophilia]|uniref:hypothetical protein n=1 Tax=Stenotrophomonas maltophilia TaxID=40324 RepID=UPI0013DB6352|nr:hypothetical protein [Stenotrophomonas maltophilia]
MTDTSCMPGRDRQRRIAWRRIGSLAAALSALVLVAGICSLQPRWQQEIGPPPVNLGTAQMQAEAMALVIRQSPPFRLPAPPEPQPTPVLPSSLSEVPTAPQTPSTRVDRWRPQEQPQLTDPVGEDIYVMEQTLPYCWPGSSASACQEVDDLVLPLDDRWPPDIHALRLQLQADLVPANRRPMPVPAGALAGAQRMDDAGLRALREQGCRATVHGPTRTYDHFAYLTRPVFSVDGQWAMIAVAWDSCSDDFVYRELVVLHREQGRWMAAPSERGLGGVWDGRVLRPWTYNH